ncbi:MAG: T9SS type A sorting domain-containing protein [Bacteroidia bacterium]
MKLQQKQNFDLKKAAVVVSLFTLVIVFAFYIIQSLNSTVSKAAVSTESIVLNGDFENGNSNWTKADGGGNSQEVNKESVYGGSGSNKVAEIDAGSSFKQTITVTKDSSYTFSFKIGHRSNAPTQTTKISVYDGSTTYLDTNITFNSGTSLSFQTESKSISPTSTSVSISFKSMSIGTLGNIIDDVELIPNFGNSGGVSDPLDPGNAGTDLKNDIKLWLKADSLVTGTTAISSWEDISQNSYTASSGSGPDKVANGYNYNPYLEFNNSDYLKITNGIAGNNTIDELYVFIVNATQSVKSSFLFYEGSSNSHRIGAHVPWSDNKAYYDVGKCCGSSRVSTNWSTSTGTNNLWTFTSSSSTATHFGKRKSIGLNGRILTSNDQNGSFNGNSSDMYIGSVSQSTMYHTGDISEMIFLEKTASQAEMNAIESYLAIKYGITLSISSSSDDGVLTNSRYQTIWNPGGATDYHEDVIGLARDDFFHLHQKQSKHTDDTVKIYINSLANTNADNTGWIKNDSSSIILGHDQGLLHSDNYAEVPSDLGISSRIGREWRVTNTNFENNFNLQVRLSNQPSASGSDIRILVSDDDDFTTATLYAPTITNNAGLLTITGITNAMIPKNSTKYFTIAAVNGASLPVEFISFEANCSSNQVILDWATATEINNDRFEIQRSGDGVLWEYIDEVTGVGNSKERQDYQYIDYSPISESYYRLKQIDFDGTTDYSEVVKVDCSNNNDKLEIVSVYPNPFQDQVSVQLSNIPSGEISISIINTSGVEIYSEIQNSVFQQNIVVNNLSNLPKGNYVLLIKANGQNLSRRLIKD